MDLAELTHPEFKEVVWVLGQSGWELDRERWPKDVPPEELLRATQLHHLAYDGWKILHRDLLSREKTPVLVETFVREHFGGRRRS